MAHVTRSNADEHAEALTQAFQGVLRHAGLDVDYVTLNAVLGVAFITCASDKRRRPGTWSTACRDLQLVRQAALFGVRLRDLHPRDAAAGLDEAGEFALHFQDSYVPLIRRALDAGQTVLAWQGWPAPHGENWGLITAEGGGPYRLAGAVGGSDRLAELVGPPIQCYVVEEIEPISPDVVSIVTAAVEAAAIALGDAAAGPTGWVIGSAAYDVWIDAARADAGGALSAPVAADTSQLAGLIAANRRTGARFFREIGDVGVFDVAPLVRGCDRVADALAPLASESGGLDAATVAERLRAAQAADKELGRAAAGCLHRIAAIR